MVTAEKEMLDNLLSRCRSGVIRWEVHFPLLSVLPSSWPVRFLCSYCLARASLVVCVRIVLCRHGLLVSKFAQPQLNKNTTETKHFLTVKSNRVSKAVTVFFLFFFASRIKYYVTDFQHARREELLIMYDTPKQKLTSGKFKITYHPEAATTWDEKLKKSSPKEANSTRKNTQHAEPSFALAAILVVPSPLRGSRDTCLSREPIT